MSDRMSEPLSLEERQRLERRRGELKAELKWVEVRLAADTSAQLRAKLKTPRRPTLERGKWRGGHWHSESDAP
jgi:hypothetical protein